VKAAGWFAAVATALSITSCIKDEAPNPEADILSLAFPENSLRTKDVEIYNDYVVAYPRPHVNLRDSDIVHIELSAGATCRRVANPAANDTLFYIDVTSESRQYTKRYSVTEVVNFPSHFGFETWHRPTAGYLYENPKDGALQWYSSNNGVAIAWNSPGKPAQDYPVRRGTLSGSMAVELRTMEGPGNIAGVMYIPCIAGSVFLGGFNALTGLTNPLRSTLFGVPFNSGKPLKLTGHYLYTEGTGDYILPDGSRDKTKTDRCDIYAVLFKTNGQVQFLYGDNIDSSPQIIARAKIRDEDIRTNELTFFELDFDYDSFPIPFSWDELKSNVYKITIVCTSGRRGQFYEGRPGNTLTVDNLNLIYDVSGI
jgi:hypothetical protein